VDEDQVSLDDIKGAYQKVSDVIYQQPIVACDSVLRHRLYRDQEGRWVIEGRGSESLEWEIRAKELRDGQWVDIKNNKLRIRAHVLPMMSILKKMDKDVLERKGNLKNNIDFLFTSCNQVKLAKLKGRNLKHHISNLKVKLEKRNALSFGVQVAKAAENIAKESECSAQK